MNTSSYENKKGVVNIKFQPVIKWSGSKRSQSEDIIKHFPKEIDTYYEPFVGGASVLRQLLHSNIKVNRYICSDINKDLIDLWNTIKDNPNFLATQYQLMWNELNADDNLDRKKQYFNKVRTRFNLYRNPEDFLFISRTCVNGKIRYNGKNKFNNSFHVTRNGIKPETFEKILTEWSSILNRNNVSFIHKNYLDIQTEGNDYLYLDPPYAGTKDLYYGAINYTELWEWLEKQSCGLALSFDGTCGDEDRTYIVPINLYTNHIYLENGNSTFKKTQDKETKTVRESLYLK